MKTPATTYLDRLRLPYELREFAAVDFSAEEAAEKLGLPPAQVFKTLLVEGDKTGYFLACLPGDRELNLKKAARATGNKKVQMAPLSDLTRVTGYLKGGCSPLGTRKRLPVYVDKSMLDFERVAVSAGQRGLQLWIEPRVLIEAAQATTADLGDE